MTNQDVSSSLAAATSISDARPLDKLNDKTFIGVDLGGTKLHVARIRADRILSEETIEFDATGSTEAVLFTVMQAIETQMSPEVEGIGLGVPSLVDPVQGIVYDTINIPSWRHVSLKTILEDHFTLPVRINNDVNCFALGEYHYGNWHSYKSLVAINLGTGIGLGLILNGQLYSGNTCGAGEIGELSYADSKLEDYCSGQLFQRTYGCSGAEAYARAVQGEAHAQDMFNTFGKHLAQAISAVLLAYNPQVIVLGGSVAKAYALFAESLQKEMESFPFQRLWQSTLLTVSSIPCASVFGATALFAEK